MDQSEQEKIRGNRKNAATLGIVTVTGLIVLILLIVKLLPWVLESDWLFFAFLTAYVATSSLVSWIWIRYKRRKREGGI